MNHYLHVAAIALAACTAPTDTDDGDVSTAASALTGSARCGESTCTAVTGSAFGSHFAEPHCTGREYYYTPYFSGGSQPNPDKIRHTWDGAGLSGTAYRTVAVRSFKDRYGTCHDDWPNGNTLSYLVHVYRTLDACPVDYHRQTEVFYSGSNGVDHRVASACVRPVGTVTCAGVIDPSYGTPDTVLRPDFDWLYSVLDSQSRPYLMQADACQDPSNTNSQAVPACAGATATMVHVFGVGPDRCAYIEL